MKSVLISIQPKWCELIASGKKTVEVRKTKPKLDTPFKCYIYETKAPRLKYVFGKKDYEGYPWFDDMDENEKHFVKFPQGKGKVIGEFVCDCIANYEAELWDDETYERIQEFFEPDDFSEYGEYEYKTIADNGDDFWRENMLCESSCLTIEELRKYVGLGIATFYGWHISDLVIYDKPKELSEFATICVNDGLNPYKCDKCEYSYKESYEIGVYEECCCNNLKPLKRPPQSWCYVYPTEKGGAE